MKGPCGFFLSVDLQRSENMGPASVCRLFVGAGICFRTSRKAKGFKYHQKSVRTGGSLRKNAPKALFTRKHKTKQNTMCLKSFEPF